MSAYSGNIVVALILVVVVIVVVVAAPVPVHLFVAFCLASCCLHCPPVTASWQGLTIAYNLGLTLPEPTPDPLPLPAPCSLRIKEFTREPCVDFNHLLHECQAHNELFGCSKSTANSRPLPTHTHTHTLTHFKQLKE